MTTRRPPPPFRRVTVLATERRNPRLMRVRLVGAELEGFAVSDPAASVRLLLPSPGTQELVVPEWNGNEFLLPGGQRPILRTFTPRHLAGDPVTLDIDIVLHSSGAAAQWAARAAAGDPAAVSGPGRGYAIDPEATAFFLAGDETAIPAISQLLEVLPAAAAVQVHLEAALPDARGPLPEHPGTTVAWHDLAPGAPPGDALVAAVKGASIGAGARVWVAGEAAGVQRIRRYLFEERAMPRALTTVRGYWKHGRSGEDASE